MSSEPYSNVVKFRVTNMAQEMLNDAKWYLSRAKAEAENDPESFAVLREVRATVLLAVASIESFVNQSAHEFVRNNPGLDRLAKDYLTESRTKYKKGQLHTEPSVFLSLEEKLKGWPKVIAGKEFQCADKIWNDFQKVLQFRNVLVHFRVEKLSEAYENGGVTMAFLAVTTAQEILVRFHEAIGVPTPGWVFGPYADIK